MRITSYEYKDPGQPGWKISHVTLSKINLLVGDTASGKTRFLNTIFNLGEFVKSNKFKTGNWKITFEHNKNTYTWELLSDAQDETANKPGYIKKDCIWKHNRDTLELLIERDSNKFTVEGIDMPRLPQSETAIWLLREDERIKPLYDAFSMIRRRAFSTEGTDKISLITPIPPKQLLPKNLSKKRTLRQIFDLDLGLNTTLYLLKRYSYESYKEIIVTYKKFFPFIKDIKIGDFSELHTDLHLSGKAPIIMLQEEGQDSWIPLAEMSSGMQKVLLILVDVYLLPDGGVYIIDEYENSLGVSAIDFFPEFVLEIEKEIQFFITSHHPYLINKIPVSNWYVFHRDGVQITIQHGNELVEKYGKSKQEAFLQLLNDPFYSRQ